MQLVIDTDKLRRLTEEARDAAETERRRREAERKAAEPSDEEVAQEIFSEITPERLERLATTGRDYYVVMDVTRCFAGPSGFISGPVGHVDPDQLTGVAKLVWDACEEANLTIEISYYDDKVEQQGYNIVIRW